MLDTGIYFIIHKKTGNRYVGSSRSDIETRWKVHEQKLNRVEHSSPRLQEVYQDEGLSGLSFKIVLYCEPFECIRYEQYFLDIWHKNGGLLNAKSLIECEFSIRFGKGYLSPRIAMEHIERRKMFNNLFNALRKEGYAHERATAIADAITEKIFSEDPTND